jgi:hypothetical protein
MHANICLKAEQVTKFWDPTRFECIRTVYSHEEAYKLTVSLLNRCSMKTIEAVFYVRTCLKENCISVTKNSPLMKFKGTVVLYSDEKST